MRLRAFALILTLALLAVAVPAQAQMVGKMYRSIMRSLSKGSRLDMDLHLIALQRPSAVA